MTNKIYSIMEQIIKLSKEDMQEINDWLSNILRIKFEKDINKSRERLEQTIQGLRK